MRGVLLLLVLLAGAWGCASPARPPDYLPRKLIILPVNNRTGDPLTVSGDGLLDRYVFHAQTVAVSDILEAEAGLQLREKGFDPAPSDRKGDKGRIPTSTADATELAAGQAGLAPVCLYIEIRRWQPEGRVHLKYVTVDVEATLIDTTSRRTIWNSSKRGPVPTPGEVLLEAAYVVAARKIISDLLAPLTHEPPAPR